MKRKFTAMLLCAALCASTISQTAFAMDFSSGETQQSVQGADTASLGETGENTAAETAQDFSGQDLFSDGAVSETYAAAETETANDTANISVTTTDAATDAATVVSSDAAVSYDSSSEETLETDEVPALLTAGGTVEAVKSSWSLSGSKWRLRKTSSSLTTSASPETEETQAETQTDTQVNIQEEQQVQESVAAEASFSDSESSEEEILPAEETAAAEETIAAEETVAAEAPAEETVAAEAPAEETVAAEVPAEETVAAEAPAEETVAAEAPAEEAITAEAPAAEASAEETLAEEPPAEETVAEETASAESALAEEPTASENEETTEESLLESPSTNYYTLSDGLIYVKTLNADSTVMSEGYYLFDNSGYLITGKYTITKDVLNTPTPSSDKAYYFMDKSHAALNTGYTGDITPWNSNFGQMQKTYWLWDGSSFSYFNDNGTFCSVDELNASNQSKSTHYGNNLFKINGYYYYLNSEGTPQVFAGYTAITNVYNGTAKEEYYYFRTTAESGLSIPGAALTAAWKGFNVNGNKRWLYFQNNGTAKTHGIMIAQLKTGTYYLLSSDGYLIRNARKKASNGGIYFSNKYGQIYRNRLVKYGNYRYYVLANGKQATWKKCWKRLTTVGNHTYYFGSVAGRVQEKTGWQKITNSKGGYAWMYFTKSGNNYVNCMKNGYLFNQYGKLLGGVQQYKGKYYAFAQPTKTAHNGHYYKNQWIKVSDSKLYYAGSNGVLYNSKWYNINGSYYCFNSDCTVKINQFVKKNGVAGYVDNYGVFCTGWVEISEYNNQVKYVNPDGSGWVKNTSMEIDGYIYYFDSNGFRMTDVSSMVAGTYLEADRVNGVMTVYNDASKTIPVKTIRISVGQAGTETPTGTYSLSQGGRWQLLMGPSYGQFASHVDGAGQGGIYIHSVSGDQPNSYSLPWAEYVKLGQPASHGCIRVCVADAYWVYTNCIGCTIRIFDGEYVDDECWKGPLGREPLEPLYGTMNFDPTDPFI